MQTHLSYQITKSFTFFLLITSLEYKVFSQRIFCGIVVASSFIHCNVFTFSFWFGRSHKFGIVHVWQWGTTASELCAKLIRISQKKKCWISHCLQGRSEYLSVSNVININASLCDHFNVLSTCEMWSHHLIKRNYLLLRLLS